MLLTVSRSQPHLADRNLGQLQILIEIFLSQKISFLTYRKNVQIKKSGQVKKTKFPISSYYHIYGWGIILG